MRESDRERFWARVAVVDDADSCWEWQGKRLPAGYGLFWFNLRQGYAHRFSVLASGREIPDGFVVMHACDNPPCVRPSHLRPGTQSENRQDSIDKGRGPLNGNQVKTHCKRGHNLNATARLTGRGNQRVCTACEAVRLRLSGAKRTLTRQAARDDRGRHESESSWLPR